MSTHNFNADSSIDQNQTDDVTDDNDHVEWLINEDGWLILRGESDTQSVAASPDSLEDLEVRR